MEARRQHIPEIDDQHKEFLEIVARCGVATSVCGSPEVMVERMAELLEHVATHFHTEEVLRRSILSGIRMSQG